MESKKANLIIDITKDIVKQYRDQLKEAIERSKNKLKEGSFYDIESFKEFNIDRPEKALKSVNIILENFDKSIFKLDEDRVYRDGVSKEEKEIIETLEGTEEIFEQIGIPKYTMYPVIADSMERFSAKWNGIEEKYGANNIELIIRSHNEKYKNDGKYNVGKLYFNKLLPLEVSAAEGLKNIYDRPVYYSFSDYENFIVDSKSVFGIIDAYIQENINPTTDLESQNKVVDDAFADLNKIGGAAGHALTSIPYSVYYYDYFRARKRYPRKYLEKPMSFLNYKPIDIISEEEKIPSMIKETNDNNITDGNSKISDLQDTIKEKEEKVKALKGILETINLLEQRNNELDKQIEELMNKINGRKL